MSFWLFIMVLSAAVFHAGWNFLARLEAGNFRVIWLAQIVGFGVLTPLAIWFLWRDEEAMRVSTASVSCMVATGLIHALYFLLLGKAYRHGEISLVYPIARGSGVGLTAVLGWLLLSENTTGFGALGIGFIFLGVLSLGADVWRRARSVYAFKLALGVGTTIVSYSLVDKVGVGLVHPVVYLWVMSMIQIGVLGPMIFRHPRGTMVETVKKEWKMAMLMGLGMTGTYTLILFAFRLAPVAYVVAVREFSVVVGATLGVVFLKEEVTRFKVGAVVLITLGIVLIKLA